MLVKLWHLVFKSSKPSEPNPAAPTVRPTISPIEAFTFAGAGFAVAKILEGHHPHAAFDPEGAGDTDDGEVFPDVADEGSMDGDSIEDISDFE